MEGATRTKRVSAMVRRHSNLTLVLKSQSVVTTVLDFASFCTYPVDADAQAARAARCTTRAHVARGLRVGLPQPDRGTFLKVCFVKSTVYRYKVVNSLSKKVGHFPVHTIPIAQHVTTLQFLVQKRPSQ